MAILTRYGTGGRVLDIGCGVGQQSAHLRSLGADYVLGVDISEKAIAEAASRAVEGSLEFIRRDVGEPVEGSFDLICGRAILHHVDFETVLSRLFNQNLRPSGAMVFMEPLSSNLVGWLYRHLIPSAHTSAERPLRRADVRWMRSAFEDVEMYPANYLSYPAAILSSFVCRRPDNLALRACDRVDDMLARRVGFLASRFRLAVFVITKKPQGCGSLERR